MGGPAAARQPSLADPSAIPVYAETAVAWARGSGIVGGKSVGRFAPDGAVTIDDGRSERYARRA